MYFRSEHFLYHTHPTYADVFNDNLLEYFHSNKIYFWHTKFFSYCPHITITRILHEYYEYMGMEKERERWRERVRKMRVLGHLGSCEMNIHSCQMLHVRKCVVFKNSYQLEIDDTFI